VSPSLGGVVSSPPPGEAGELIVNVVVKRQVVFFGLLQDRPGGPFYKISVIGKIVVIVLSDLCFPHAILTDMIMSITGVGKLRMTDFADKCCVHVFSLSDKLARSAYPAISLKTILPFFSMIIFPLCFDMHTKH
jgi:hypothetical protein